MTPQLPPLTGRHRCTSRDFGPRPRPRARWGGGRPGGGAVLTPRHRTVQVRRCAGRKPGPRRCARQRPAMLCRCSPGSRQPGTVAAAVAAGDGRGHRRGRDQSTSWAAARTQEQCVAQAAEECVRAKGQGTVTYAQYLRCRAPRCRGAVGYPVHRDLSAVIAPAMDQLGVAAQRISRRRPRETVVVALAEPAGGSRRRRSIASLTSVSRRDPRQRPPPAVACCVRGWSRPPPP